MAMTLYQFKGKLDILVNNASTIGPSPMPYLLDYRLEDFHYVINTNLVAPFLMIKKALPAMIENGGSIINVTSNAGAIGYPGWGAYGISKFGIEGMLQTWAAELEGIGVRVSYVDLGNMNTAMHRAPEPDEVNAGHGYTRLHITANHKLKIVDSLLTGFHEPEASHLDLLTAFLPAERIHKPYDEAIRKRYLWHEFGDLNLIL